MIIIKYKSIFIGISILLVVASVFLMNKYGLKKGVDFTGGTVIDISYNSEVKDLNSSMFKNEVDVYKTSDNSYRIISSNSYEEIQGEVGYVISDGGKITPNINQVSTIGPTMGSDMTKKAIIAIVLVVIAILLFIAFSFRTVSYPVSSWKYGVVAMGTLIHDIIIPTGVYVLLSKNYGAEVDTLFVIALLTIMAISISDKIVVFDRIRENLRVSKGSFDEIVGKSLNETITRSINTSVTVVLALLALFFFGPSMTKWFTLTLMIGMVVGTYSSICVASPILTIWNKKK